jgi:hypothetical protein
LEFNEEPGSNEDVVKVARLMLPRQTRFLKSRHDVGAQTPLSKVNNSRNLLKGNKLAERVGFELSPLL